MEQTIFALKTDGEIKQSEIELLKKNKNCKIYIINKSKNLTAINDIFPNKTLHFCCNPTNINNYTTFIGLNLHDLDQDMLDYLNNNTIQYYTLNKINQIGLGKIFDKILDGSLMNIIIDCEIFNKFESREFVTMVEYLKHRTKVLIINSVDDNFDNELKNKFNFLVQGLFGNSGVNLISENTKFLIYRSVDQIDDKDIGWKIIRNISWDDLNKLIETIGDSITTIDLDDENGNEISKYVTVTSVREQNEKSFFTSKSIRDTCLVPEDKIDMIIELLKFR